MRKVGLYESKSSGELINRFPAALLSKTVAIFNVICYSVSGATSTPVGGSPWIFLGVMYFLPPIERKGVRAHDYMAGAFLLLFGHCNDYLADYSNHR